MSRYARRVDANQTQVVAALRKVGALVHPLSRVGDGVPDLLVSYRCELHLLEVKDGTLPPSRRALTPDEAEWHQRWAGPRVHVVTSVDEALRAIGAVRAA